MVTAAVSLVCGCYPQWGAERVIEAVLGSCRPCAALRGRCRAEGVLDLAALLGGGDLDDARERMGR
jgi:hypothetical protein